MNFSNMHRLITQTCIAFHLSFTRVQYHVQAREVNHASKGNVPHSIQRKGMEFGGKITVFKLVQPLMNQRSSKGSK